VNSLNNASDSITSRNPQLGKEEGVENELYWEAKTHRSSALPHTRGEDGGS